MLYAVDYQKVDELYIKPIDLAVDEIIRDMRIAKMRTRTTISGPMVEVEVYPLWYTRADCRAKKSNPSRVVQQDLNHKHAVKRLVRLINTNFTEDVDIWIHLGYSDDKLPPTFEEAMKRMQKYIRKLRKIANKRGYGPLKYVYVTGGGEGSDARYHHHLVINFPDRDAAELAWDGGKYPRANRLRLSDSLFQFEGMANYMGKHISGKKRYVTSHGLKQPIVHRADNKISRNMAHKIATGRVNPIKLFEKLYKNCKFIDINTYISDHASGTYIYARMRRME